MAFDIGLRKRWNTRGKGENWKKERYYLKDSANVRKGKCSWSTHRWMIGHIRTIFSNNLAIHFGQNPMKKIFLFLCLKCDLLIKVLKTWNENLFNLSLEWMTRLKLIQLKLWNLMSSYHFTEKDSKECKQYIESTPAQRYLYPSHPTQSNIAPRRYIHLKCFSIVTFSNKDVHGCGQTPTWGVF